MKKISLVFLVAALSTTGFAQPPKFGIKAGVNFATTNNSVSGASGNKLGLNLGVLSHIHLSPEFSLQPEVYYSGQGGTVGDVDVNLNYINIPVLVQYNFDNGFRLQTGPQLGLLTSVSSKVDGNDVDFFSSDDFKSTDVSWSFGLGYLTYSGFGIDARYNLGLTQINDAGSGKTTNRVLQLGLFYLLDHHHKARSK